MISLRTCGSNGRYTYDLSERKRKRVFSLKSISEPKKAKLYEFDRERALKSCEPGQWIVEDVVNLWIDTLQKSLDRKGDKRFIIFNSFFWPKLKDDIKSAARLVKWIKQELWKAQYWLIPIHSKDHWFLCVVRLPKDMYSCRKIRVYALDSLKKQPVTDICRIIRHFITASWEHAHKANSSEVNHFKQIFLSAKRLRVPKQTNGCDCGFFMLRYIEKFIGDPIKKHNEKWFEPESVSKLREKLYNVIKYVTR